MNEEKITAVIIEDDNIEGLIELEKLRGPNGFSAYELYLKNLPEGEEPLSELEWVNSISKVNYYKQYYQNYRTTIDNESDVPIELENFNETCVLNVYLNGFRLRDDEYLIDYENKKLVLKNPISKNQDVSLFMLKTAVVTSDTFDLLKGEKGDIGLSNTLTIGTVEDGDVADATITGVSPNQILNLVLPKGKIGDQGPKGEPGTGVPSGGTSGQVLAKKTDSDNDTEWIDPPATGGGLGGDTSPVGTVYLWYSDTIPDNYLLCNGQAVSRVDYDELFNLWGTMYGSGDGSTTFNIPDLRDYVPVGKSDDVNLNEIGKKYGEKNHLLTVEEMPSHTHTAKAKAGAQAGNNAYLIDAGGSGSFGVNNNTGGDQAHNNMQPSIATNFIVKAYQKTPVEGAIVDSVEGNSSTDAPSVRAVNNALKKGVMSLYFSNYKSTGALGTPNYSLYNSYGNGLTFQSNGIKIGSGITHVLISGWGFINSAPSGAGIICGFFKNGILIDNPINTSAWLQANANNDNLIPELSPTLIQVEEGDVLALALGVNGNTSVSFSRGVMTVQVVG